MIKNLAIGAVAIAALVTGVVNYNSISQIESQPAKIVERLGSVASPDIQSPYLSVAGVRKEYRRTTSLNSATTTICTIQAPTYATSSLAYASVNLTSTPTTTATTNITLSKVTHSGTTPPSASSTPILRTDAITASALYNGNVASSTPFSPGEYLVVSLQGGTVPLGNSKYSPSGVCQAEFIVNL